LTPSISKDKKHPVTVWIEGMQITEPVEFKLASITSNSQYKTYSFNFPVSRHGNLTSLRGTNFDMLQATFLVWMYRI
jgi:hypothetical protein